MGRARSLHYEGNGIVHAYAEFAGSRLPPPGRRRRARSSLVLRRLPPALDRHSRVTDREYARRRYSISAQCRGLWTLRRAERTVDRHREASAIGAGRSRSSMRFQRIFALRSGFSRRSAMLAGLVAAAVVATAIAVALSLGGG